MKSPVLCLMGPTATGKTELAIELVGQLPVDIISVDSVMVYRGMDIGTAKPDAATLEIAPHRLIDICDPANPYSAAQFRDDARQQIKAIHAAGKIPLLVGGTMLYFRALLQGLSVLPMADQAVRARLLAEAEALGWDALHQRLMEVDPEAALRIHKNDSQRLQRALEVYELTGQPLSTLQKRTEGGLDEIYRVIKIVLMPEDRKILHTQIEKRFQEMLTEGFIEEVEGFYARKELNENLPAMRSVGYRQVWQYLDGKMEKAQLHEKGVAATRQLAKRQITWLRSEVDTSQLDPQQTRLEQQVSHVKYRVHTFV
ncbi:MAG: tRNA (adenosine(37)-N6)-dimethylallyltransferase MiaA [Thiothrix sp.]|nr:MAG: tRNA (adenosine(37)-N6)-dimethylallyltransferase MiaA [Thiothrix sp.]